MISIDRAALHALMLEAAKQAIREERANQGADRLVSTEEAARHVGMSPSWIRARIRSGDLPARRLGSAVRVRLGDLAQLGTSQQPAKATDSPKARALKLVRGDR